MPTRCLSIHAGYRCRHRGACCRADWTIDVDERIAEAVRTRRVVPLNGTAQAFISAIDGTGATTLTLARTAEGDCAFHRSQRCSLQASGGETMLPSACRHFPRILLRDGRGCLLTLSHFCPTAAELLLHDAPISIVDAEPPLALSEPLDALDARSALPPLLHPGMLMDLAGYSVWENCAIQLFASSARASIALTAMSEATEHLRRWTPRDGPLRERVPATFASNVRSEAPSDLSRGFDIARSITGPHPDMDLPPGFPEQWERIESGGEPFVHRAIGRYMAAATFANWMAYRGRGLRTVIEWFRACFGILRLQMVRESAQSGGRLTRDGLVASFGRADYLAVHTIDSLAFGRQASIIER